MRLSQHSSWYVSRKISAHNTTIPAQCEPKQKPRPRPGTVYTPGSGEPAPRLPQELLPSGVGTARDFWPLLDAQGLLTPHRGLTSNSKRVANNGNYTLSRARTRRTD